jgi:hypothetical protein
MAISGADGNLYYHDDEERYESFNRRWDAEFARIQKQLQDCELAAPRSAQSNNQYRTQWQARDRLRLLATLPRRRKARRSRRGQGSTQRYRARRNTFRRPTDQPRQQSSPQPTYMLPELYPVNTNEWD